MCAVGPLVPIEYSEEEKASVAPPPVAESAAPAKAELSAEEVKALIATIPTKKEDLFKYEVSRS